MHEHDHTKRELERQVRALVGQALGREYKIRYQQLDAGSLRELVRLLRDMEAEKNAALQRLRINPWLR